MKHFYSNVHNGNHQFWLQLKLKAQSFSIKISFVLLFFFLSSNSSQVNAQTTCTSEKGWDDFPFTENGLTVSVSYTGSYARYGGGTDCGITQKDGAIWLGQSQPSTMKTTYSSSVNDMVYNFLYANSGEVLTVTANAGTITATHIDGDCSANISIVGNVVNFVGSAGARLLFHSTEPFTEITFAHNGSGSGVVTTMCFDAVFASLGPSVTTTSMSTITGTTASSGGNVTDDGGETVTARGVCWNTTGTPTISDDYTTNGTGVGTFTSSLTGLTSGTTYYARAYATNSVGTGYGEVESFTTLSSMLPPGNALDFDGTGDKVICGNDVSTQIGGTAISLEAWIKPTALDGGSHEHTIISKSYTVSDTYGYDLRCGANGVLDFVLAGQGNTWAVLSTPTGTLTLNEWQHVAATYDGTTQKIFINGVLSVSNTTSITIQANTVHELFIGEQGFYGGREFNGLIDEVRIWNDARTETEIRDNLDYSLVGNEANLVAYYNFDNSVGTALTDNSTNSNTGTLTNMTDADWVSSGAMIYAPTALAASSLAANIATANWEIDFTASKYYIDVSAANDFSSYVSGYQNKEITGQTTVSQAITGLSEGTVYYYRLRAYNENTVQTSANSNVVSLTTQVTSPGNALDFDGANDFISIPANATLNNNSFTVEFWTKFDDVPSGYDGIMDKGRDIAGNDWYFYAIPGAQAGMFGLEGISEIWFGLNSGWNHFAGTFDGTNMVAYINGVPIDTLTGSFAGSTNGIVMGRRTAGTSYFNGHIDEVRIWNDARSATEIKTNFDNSLTGSETGLVAYYNFNAASGAVLSDQSSNSNHGALNNMDDSDWVESYGMVIPISNDISIVTKNSFTFTWNTPETGIVEKYYLDVDDNADFSSPISGYNSLDVGLVNSKIITGLNEGTTYYARVRAYKSSVGDVGALSETKSAKTLSAPITIALDNKSISEMVSAGTVVGNLSSTGVSGSYSYSLFSGTGDTDNAKFAIDGNQLKTNWVFDYENQTSASIRIQSNDGSGTLDSVYVININDQVSPITFSGYIPNYLELNENTTFNGTTTIDSVVTVAAANSLVVQDSIKFTPGSTASWQPTGLIDDGSLIVKGLITAEGSVGDTIVFTRNGIAENWGGVVLENANDNSIFDFCKFEYGSGIDTFYWNGSEHNDVEGALNILDTDATVTNSLFINNQQGIFCANDASTISNNTITLSGNDGIDCEDNSNATISYNVISFNEDDGIDVESGSSPTIQYNNISENDDCGLEIEDAVNPLISNNIIFSNGDSGIEIENTFKAIISYNTINESEYNGIWAGDCDTIQIIHNTLSGNGASDDVDGDYLEGIHIDASTFYMAYDTVNQSIDDGIYLLNESSGIIENCIVQSNGDDGIDIESDTWVEIRNCNISENDDDGITAEDGGDDIEISDNTILDNGYYGIYLDGGMARAIISKNQINDNAYEGINIYECDTIQVVGNTIAGNGWDDEYYGIYIESSTFSINNDTIADNFWDGIYTIDSDGNISNCLILRNGDDGIDMEESSGIIQSNIISNNSGDGIEIDDSSPEVLKNTISGNDDGIYVRDSDANPTIKSNIIFSNIDDGINTSRFSNANIVNNLIYENGDTGIELDESSPTITNNTIANNDYGIYFDEGEPTPVITNTIVYGHGGDENELDEGAGAATVSNSLIADYSGGTNNIDADPLFTNATLNDYTLTVCSPAINVGTTDTTGLYLPTLDLAGESRVKQARIDIGAYEGMQDTFPPTALCQNLTVYLDENGEATVSAIDIDNSSSDNCGIASTVLNKTSFDCSEVGTNTVTLTVTDVNTNSSTCEATVTVADNTSPTALCQNLTVRLNAEGVSAITASQIDDGSSDACGIGSLYISKSNFTWADIGENEVVLTVEDNSGNLSTCDAIVTVLEPVEPQVQCNSIDLYLDETGKYYLTDLDLDALAAGTTDDEDSFSDLWIQARQIAFSCKDIGQVKVDIVVTDTDGNRGYCRALVSIIDTNSVAITEVDEVFVELESGVCETQIAYPEIVSMSACAEVEHVNGLGPDGIFPVGTTVETWKATNTSGDSAMYSFNVVVTSTNFDPEIDVIEDLIVVENSAIINVPLTGIFYGADCLSQDLTITALSQNSELVSAIEVDYTSPNTTGSLDITLVENMFGTDTITVTVTDSDGAEESVVFTLKVNPIKRRPTIDAIADVYVDEDSLGITIALTGISFGNNTEAQSLSITARGINQALVDTMVVRYSSPESTASIDLTLEPNAFGTDTIRVTVIDNLGGATSRSFVLHVNPVNDAPYLLEPLPDLKANASYSNDVSLLDLMGIVFDDIDDDILTFDVFEQETGILPDWAVIESDIFTASPMLADTGSYHFIVIAIDTSGAMATDTFAFKVAGYPTEIGTFDEGVFEVRMYPNPSKGEVNLQINSSEIGDAEVVVRSITGSEVFRKKYLTTDQIRIDLTDQSSGIYLVTLKQSDQSIIKKLILDRK